MASAKALRRGEPPVCGTAKPAWLEPRDPGEGAEKSLSQGSKDNLDGAEPLKASVQASAFSLSKTGCLQGFKSNSNTTELLLTGWFGCCVRINQQKGGERTIG